MFTEALCISLLTSMLMTFLFSWFLFLYLVQFCHASKVLKHFFSVISKNCPQSPMKYLFPHLPENMVSVVCWPVVNCPVLSGEEGHWLIASACQFPWCKCSHHCPFHVTKVISLNIELEREVHNWLSGIPVSVA